MAAYGENLMATHRWTFQQNEGARRFYERHGLHLIRLTNGDGNEEKTPDALYAWRRGSIADPRV